MEQMEHNYNDLINIGGTIKGRVIGRALGAVVQVLHNIWRSKEVTNSSKVKHYEILILSIYTIKKEGR